MTDTQRDLYNFQRAQAKALNLHGRLVDACIEMSAGEIVYLDEDVVAELKRRGLIVKASAGDANREGADYTISGTGQQLAERVLKARGVILKAKA